MANPNPHVAEFIALFNQTARYHHRYEVFRDFVQMAACAVHNQVVFSRQLEDEYLGWSSGMNPKTSITWESC